MCGEIRPELSIHYNILKLHLVVENSKFPIHPNTSIAINGLALCMLRFFDSMDKNRAFSKSLKLISIKQK